jgi:hypothetical protein
MKQECLPLMWLQILNWTTCFSFVCWREVSICCKQGDELWHQKVHVYDCNLNYILYMKHLILQSCSVSCEWCIRFFFQDRPLRKVKMHSRICVYPELLWNFAYPKQSLVERKFLGRSSSFSKKRQRIAWDTIPKTEHNYSILNYFII